jgi:hypothetical protein
LHPASHGREQGTGRAPDALVLCYVRHFSELGHTG